MSLPKENQVKRMESDSYVEGYATTFEPYVLFNLADGTPIYEVVDRHAFDNADMSDVVLRYDHAGPVYARTTNNTLGLDVTDKGLFCYADLSKTKRSKELYEDISAGNITKMSIECTVDRDFDDATDTFIIRKVKRLIDVSAVGVPANDDTSLMARDFEKAIKEQEEHAKTEHERKRKMLELKLELGGY